jgi:hypothetical protein
LSECEHGEARASTGPETIGRNGDAPDQLEAGAPDHRPGFVLFDPEVTGRLVETGKGEVGVA